MAIAVVTGANSGIGLATARRLVADGHDVYAGARSDAGLETIAAVGEERLHPLSIDVTVDDSVADAFARVRAEAGEVEILVNNAGVGLSSAVEDCDLDAYRAIMEANFFGAVRCTKEVLPAMRAAGQGRIVMITSLAAMIASPTMSAYCASKFALEGFSEALQQEVAPLGVHVIVIEPGTILTPIFGKAPPPPRGSAYRHSYKYLGEWFGHTLPRGTDPQVVADLISTRISEDAHPLKTPVSWDSEAVANARTTVVNEDVFALWSTTGADFRARHIEAYGMDLWQ